MTVMTDYFTADLHLYHKNVIQYESRPFIDLDDMHKEIIKRWNSVVKSADRVFVLGDVTFSNKENTRKIIERLNGEKILIKGNHDKERSDHWFFEAGFDRVIGFTIIYNGFFILSHEPVYLNDHMPYANIHGHLHRLKYEGKQHVNVGVDLCDFAPISFEQIKEYLGIVEDER